MRTTFHLPDELYRELRRTTAADGVTMTSFVEEALREALRRRTDGTGRVVVDLAPATGAGWLLPGVDLSDSAALLDLMGER